MDMIYTLLTREKYFLYHHWVWRLLIHTKKKYKRGGGSSPVVSELIRPVCDLVVEYVTVRICLKKLSCWICYDKLNLLI